MVRFADCLQFNTATSEIESVTEELAYWRNNIYSPLLLNIYFDLETGAENSFGPRAGTLLERWKLVFDQKHAPILVRCAFTTADGFVQ